MPSVTLSFFFRSTIEVSNHLDPDQYQRSVGPNLGPNCCKGYQQTTKVTVGLESQRAAKFENVVCCTFLGVH